MGVVFLCAPYLAFAAARITSESQLLPVDIDPSHPTGSVDLVIPISNTVVGIGAGRSLAPFIEPETDWGGVDPASRRPVGGTVRGTAGA